METQTNGNGQEAPTEGKKEEAKKESVLVRFEKTWLERTKGKLPDKKTIEGFKTKLQSILNKEKAALDAAEKAKVEFDEYSQEVLAACGRRNIGLDGVTLEPMSRGDRVYYKRVPKNEDL